MKVSTGLCIIIAAAVSDVSGKTLLMMGEKSADCTKGGARYSDWSKLEYEYVNDTAYFLNGVLRIRKKIVKPWRMHYFIEKYDRGQWHSAIVNREIKDFCQVIDDVKAPWAPFVNHMKQRQCPFDAGHEERFNMEYVSEARLPEYFGYTMTGRYRVFLVSYFAEDNGKVFEECLKMTFEIMSL